jgi:hypothetical protein
LLQPVMERRQVEVTSAARDRAALPNADQKPSRLSI